MRTYKRYGPALGFGFDQEAFNVLAIGLKVSECGVDCLSSESKSLAATLGRSLLCLKSVRDLYII